MGRSLTWSPSTPDDPADGFVAAVEKALDQVGIGADALTAQGYCHILEIARQSVPDRYGNSYAHA